MSMVLKGCLNIWRDCLLFVIIRMNNWYKLICNNCELQLSGTLNGGQSFRWSKHLEDNQECWIGVFKKRVWILKQNETEILYKVFETKCGFEKKEIEERNELYNNILKDYFQLNLSLREYYQQWSEADPIFKKAAQQFYGIRILNQDVTENIFSFICSSNNNISRISSMVNKLAKFYGDKICEINGETYYSFPDVENLTQPGVEAKLRENGFGYRAKYITKSAEMIKEKGGEMWLEKLKGMDYEEAKESLMTLTGIGAKVADCICLMSLGHLGALPVDTHVYQIAAKFYMPHIRNKKTVTKKMYDEIGDHFRKLYGPLAGWAHTVLFCADLKKFQGEL
ncbi:N-glycosylase/DNA lyase [Coccinella septempunctata]|uniref:N-glycosylase/DNA lyase n=1 Tax=Coccinella septempunctata TaxID=41139 RepID=UPI001D07D429|nr:N-glycosylase/DNA lyase [Coccinella septempunctata]